MNIYAMKIFTVTVYVSVNAETEEDARELAFSLEDVIEQVEDKSSASINPNTVNIEVEEAPELD